MSTFNTSTNVASAPVLFLGATGGCTLNALTHTLTAGHSATALVRSSSKLTGLLRDQQGLDSASLSHLTIVEGNATSVEKMKAALTATTTTTGGSSSIPPLIICGIGGLPKLQASIIQPFVLDQPTVCEDTLAALFTALKKIQSESARAGVEPRKPTVLFISSTGITSSSCALSGSKSTSPSRSESTPRDIPVAFMPLYHWLLSSPHADKRRAEELILKSVSSPSAPSSPIQAFIIIRPSLLTDGHGNANRGSDATANKTANRTIKVGTESNPAVGYTISRAEVGRWIWEEVIRDFVADGATEWGSKTGENICRWQGEKVTLTA